MCKGYFEESESEKNTQEKPGSIKCSFENYEHKFTVGLVIPFVLVIPTPFKCSK